MIGQATMEVIILGARFSLQKLGLCRAAYMYDVALRQEFGPLLCGIDEAGRGPLAGPVVAAAVILPPDLSDAPFFDSKQLTPSQRSEAFNLVHEVAIACAVGVVEAADIDRMNILQATYLAMRKAVFGLTIQPSMVLVDGTNLPGIPYAQRKLIHGDAISQSIAAASILAKVTRDEKMVQADKQYPSYGFAKHVGYGTREHLEALQTKGPSPIHRMSFRPVLEAAKGARVLATIDKRSGHARIVAGKSNEDVALMYLQQKGYRLIDRNWHRWIGELDLIMQADEAIVFVEVRSKKGGLGTDLLQAAESVNAEKRQHIRRLATLFIQEHADYRDLVCRFDVVTVTWTDALATLPRVEHYIAAFS